MSASKIRALERFIEKAKLVHQDKYDYSKAQYINVGTDVIIICKTHGEFNQKPKDHYTGRGCRKCFHNKISYTTEKFIEKAKEIHGDMYDYSEIDYINSKTDVDIICKKHGKFKQRPSNHINGSGCTKCSLNKKSTKMTFTTELFICKSKELFPDKFDYTKTKYKNTRTDIELKCIEHNQEFTVNAGFHIQKSETGGCPKCVFENLSKLRAKPQDTVY